MIENKNDLNAIQTFYSIPKYVFASKKDKKLKRGVIIYTRTVKVERR